MALLLPSLCNSLFLFYFLHFLSHPPARAANRTLARRFNEAPEAGDETSLAFLRTWLGSVGDSVIITPPFRCDYGRNIHLGAGVYMNFDTVMLDCARISIGARTLFGPGVHIYAATHPLDSVARRTGESANPVEIGADCWIGGRAIVMCSGTKGEVRRIGDGCIIGAGAVVTRDIPPYSLAVGNPAKVVRKLQ